MIRSVLSRAPLPLVLAAILGLRPIPPVAVSAPAPVPPAAVPVPATAGRPLGGPVTLLMADARSAVVELALPPYRMDDVYSPSRGFEREIRVPGWSYGGEPGRPKLPLTGTLLQVPAGGQVRLTILEAESDSLYGHANPSVPRPAWDGEGGATLREERDPAIFGRSAFFPGPLAELGEPAVMRGVPIARLLFHPFQWNPVTRELRAYRRLRVRVDFDRPLPGMPGASAMGGDGDAFAGIERSQILNRVGGTRLTAAPAVGPKSPAAWSRAVRIQTERRGIHSVSYEELVAQGMPESQSPAGLKLLNRGRETAFAVRPGGGAAMGPGDSLVFYAEDIDSKYTRANVYWLTWEDGGGARMAERAAAPAGGEEVSVYREEIRLEPKLGIWYQTPGAPEAEYWVWVRLTAPTELFVPLTLADDALADAHEMQILTSFQGRSTDGHRTSIALNNETWSDERWAGAQAYVQTAKAPQSEAKPGYNVVKIKAPGTPGQVDVVYLKGIEVLYWRPITALDDAIEFGLEDRGRIEMEVGGFSAADIEAYDVTDPRRPVILGGFGAARVGGRYVAGLGDVLTESRRYFVARRSRLLQPAKVEAWESPGLRDAARRADLIVITPRELERAGAALAAFRMTRRVRTELVAAEDIYDDFNDGILDPSAIKDFLAYAYASWRRPAPAYVALLGDATIDAKGYVPGSRTQQIPCYMDWTAEYGVTPTDAWYACVDGDDDIPDLMIGRIPGGSPETAMATIDKLIGAEAARRAPAGRVLLAADNDQTDFEMISDKVLDFLPQGYEAVKVYLKSYGSPAQAAEDVVAAINGGVDLVSYVGHGSVTDWAGEKLFGVSKIESLANGARLPLVCMFDCMSGFYAGTTQDCLAEALIRAPEKGAAACFAPVAVGFPWEHGLLLPETMALLFGGGAPTLGYVTTQARIAAYAKGITIDTFKTFMLFGDPSMVR